MDKTKHLGGKPLQNKGALYAIANSNVKNVKKIGKNCDL